MSILIGLGGKLRSGKDATADYLEQEYGFVKMGMSDILHEITMELNPWFKLDYPIRVGYLRTAQWEPVRYRDIIEAVGYVEAKKHSEIREWLQTLGTEVGRNMIYENIWVDVAQRKIKNLLDTGNDVVLTATRFPNEIAMIKSLGGATLWIERDAERRLEGLESSGKGSTPGKGSSLAHEAHSSEESVSKDDFDFVITNNGTLDELYAAVRTFLFDSSARRVY